MCCSGVQELRAAEGPDQTEHLAGGEEGPAGEYGAEQHPAGDRLHTCSQGLQHGY